MLWRSSPKIFHSCLARTPSCIRSNVYNFGGILIKKTSERKPWLWEKMKNGCVVTSELRIEATNIRSQRWQTNHAKGYWSPVPANIIFLNLVINLFYLYFASENKNLLLFCAWCLRLWKSFIAHFSINEYLRGVLLNYYHLLQNCVFT